MTRASLLVLLVLLGCSSRTAGDPAYAPTQSVLEVISVLRLHIDDDTYRFPPARDFTGKNVYRTALARLESLEELHSQKFRSGYLVDVLLFAKARALERLTEFELAAQHYSRVMDLESPLSESASVGRSICERLHEASRLTPSSGVTPEQAMATFDRRTARLDELAADAGDTHYGPVIQEEIERADRARADYFAARRGIEPWLDVIALQQHQRLVQKHAKSKNRNSHLLDLADLYAGLCRQYVRRNPSSSLGFDPATFDEYAFNATRIYEAVSQRDGAVEKIEASRKLEAFLAFTLLVYEEKLPR